MIPLHKVILILGIAILASTPLMNKILFEHRFSATALGKACENCYLVVVLLLSITYIAASTYNPFIYFRF